MTKIERRKEAIKPIPPFTSIEEEAEFWDTHSTADFGDEFEEVKDVKFVVRRSPVDKALTVRVDRDTFVRLVEEARTQDIGQSTLVRMWIVEHLGERGGRHQAS